MYYCTEITETLVMPSIAASLRKKCTVFPFHPWDHKIEGRVGAVLWVPGSIEELIKMARKQLKYPDGSVILSQHGGRILDVDLINNDEKLFIISEPHIEGIIEYRFAHHE